MPKEARTIHRFRLATPVGRNPDFAAWLVPTRDRRWLAKTAPGYRYTFAGVPARRGDAFVQDGLIQDVPPDHRSTVQVVEVVEKVGRYDGAVRTQLTFRWGQPKQWEPFSVVEFYGQLSDPPEGRRPDGTLDLVVGLMDPATKADYWSLTMHQEETSIDGYDVGRILMWHWTRYYRFIPRKDAEQEAAAFAAELSARPPRDLADANRRASQSLYALARGLGWRKLTLREQSVYGVSGQWHRAETLVRPGKEFHPTGTGEATRDAAAGKSVIL